MIVSQGITTVSLGSITLCLCKKTISITQQMSSWVKSQVESGQYGNDSEYFRDLIRSDQQKKVSRESTSYYARRC